MEEDIGCTLSDLLLFFLGTDQIPPLGFDIKPTLTFIKHGKFPTASTCDIQLRLPTTQRPIKSSDIMILALKCNDSFGAGP